MRAVREGIKLRSIKSTIAMNEIGSTAGNFNQKRLIIQRLLGFKELIPGSGQWKLYMNGAEDCTHCT